MKQIKLDILEPSWSARCAINKYYYKCYAPMQSLRRLTDRTPGVMYIWVIFP